MLRWLREQLTCASPAPEPEANFPLWSIDDLLDRLSPGHAVSIFRQGKIIAWMITPEDFDAVYTKKGETP